MKALLWKDYHVNRIVLAAGVFALVLPYAITTAVKLINILRGDDFES